ncbi:prepilin-type N-terminal cleavage/methylation domain-containing protein [candidate division WWE3 bacterium]|uniref:Prepilin-type N-terminal cleavage/methylation domain-containing protein n=1 Tax=candidate division WWE3 bacterium TaxID=2053526 RepID=A0A955RXE5_UNCKA|nr:prepilin-type N-terminal cleavage/methylation domain-containing protein [candidate division WWE3 bacterium]
MTHIQPLNNQKGASLVEILIAILLFGIILASIILGFTNVARNEHNARVRGQAINLAREGLEAIYVLAEGNWSLIDSTTVGSTYQVNGTSGEWQLVSGSETIGEYTREIIFTNATRKSDGNLDTDGSFDSGDYEDTETKIITVTVTWNSFGKNFDYSQSTIFSNWKEV